VVRCPYVCNAGRGADDVIIRMMS